MKFLKCALFIGAMLLPSHVLADSIAGSAGTYIGQFLNEGSTITRRSKVNWIGSGVDCVDNSGAKRTDCTVTGGGGGGGLPLTPGDTNYIQNRNTLQSGASFYVAHAVADRLGIGTDAPAEQIHLYGTAPVMRIETHGVPNFFKQQVQFYTGPAGFTSLSGSWGWLGTGSTGPNDAQGFVLSDGSANTLLNVPYFGNQFMRVNNGIRNRGGVSYEYASLSGDSEISTFTYINRITAGSTDITVRLPDMTDSANPSYQDLTFVVCKVDASTNTITFVPSSDDNISTPIILYAQNECVELISSVSGTVGNWQAHMRSVGNIGGTYNMPVGASVSTFTITSLPSESCLGTDGSGNVIAGTCGGGGGGGGSALEVFSNFDALKSSPTASISLGDAMKMTVSGSTAVITVDQSSVTLKGQDVPVLTATQTFSGFNTFNSSSSFNHFVGIGTTTAIAGLNVHSYQANAPLATFHNSNTTSNNPAILRIGSNAGGSLSSVSMENYNGDYVFRTGDTSLTSFGDIRMRLAANGPIGLGSFTGTPTSTVTINGELAFPVSAVGTPYVGLDYGSSEDSLRFKANVGASTLNTTHAVLKRATGRFGLGTTSPDSSIHIVSKNSVDVASIVQGAAAQTSPLTQWKDSSGAVLSSVTAAGAGYFPEVVSASITASERLRITKSKPAQDVEIIIENTSSSAGSAAALRLAAEGGTYDPRIRFVLGAGGDDWVMGIDNSDSDSFKISADPSELGTNNAVRFDFTTRIATFTADVYVPAEAYGSGWLNSLEVPTKKDIYDKFPPSTTEFSLGTVFSGGGSVITVNSTSTAITVPYNCVISSWVVTGATGTITIDVRRTAYGSYTGSSGTTSIVGGGTAPGYSVDVKGRSIPSSWTSTTLAADDVIQFAVTSVTDVTEASIVLKCTKTP